MIGRERTWALTEICYAGKFTNMSETAHVQKEIFSKYTDFVYVKPEAPGV